MAFARCLPSTPVPVSWRAVVLPKEHGTWSLAFEPVVFGLLIAPTMSGLLFAGAVAAAFFARRPLAIAGRETQTALGAAARNAAFACACVSLGFVVAVAARENVRWLVSVLPSAIAGAIFLQYDLRGGGREAGAEIAGSAAFAFLPAVFATLGGTTGSGAMAAALLMAGRAIGAVLLVRCFLRTQKTGEARPAMALAAAWMAPVLALTLAKAQFAPLGATIVLVLLAVRASLLLLLPIKLRARTLGKIEAVAGVLFVGLMAWLWRG